MSKNKATKSKVLKIKKRELLVRKIIEALRNGELAPGDTLMSLNDMQETYGVSRYAAFAAMNELAERGFIVRKPRSGYCISAEATELVKENNDVTKPHILNEEPFETEKFYSPLTHEHPLCVYISEGFPEVLAPWEEVLTDFGRLNNCKIKLLSLADGHIQEILSGQPVDIIYSANQVITELHREKQLSTALNFKQLNLKEDDFISPVKNFLQKRNIPGIPFSVSFKYLYINLDLWEKLSGQTSIPNDLLELFKISLKSGLYFDSDLTCLMQLIDAFHFDADGRAILDNDKTGEFLDLLSDVKTPDNSHDRGAESIRQFVKGKALFSIRGSYEMSKMRNKVNFNWTTIPLASPRNHYQEGFLLLLTIHRNSSKPQLCFDLLKYLLQDHIQTKLSRPNGNLSAIREHLFDGVINCKPELIEKCLNQLTFCSSCQIGREFNREATASVDAFRRGEIPREETLSRLTFLYEHFISHEG
jgi:hypothetical protein